jgi:hypothetical protein
MLAGSGAGQCGKRHRWPAKVGNNFDRFPASYALRLVFQTQPRSGLVSESPDAPCLIPALIGILVGLDLKANEEYGVVGE